MSIILTALRWLAALFIAIGERRGRAEARQEQAAATTQAAQQAATEARLTQEKADAEVVAYRRDGARQRLRDGAF